MSRIYRRGQKWYLDYAEGGRRVRVRARGATRREAEADLAERVHAAGAAERGPDGSYPVARLLDRWERALDLADLSARTVRDYLVSARMLLDAMGQPLTVGEITREGVESALAAATELCARRTVSKWAGALRRMLAHGEGLGVVAPGMLEGVTLRGRGRSESRGKSRRALSRWEADRLLDVAPPRWARIWRLYLATGLRRAEAGWLRWSDVDLDRAVLHVRPHDGWAPKTAAGHRTVPFSAPCLAALREMRQDGQPDHYVLATYRLATEEDAARWDARAARGTHCPTARPIPGRRAPLGTNLNRSLRSHLRAVYVTEATRRIEAGEPLPDGVARDGRRWIVPADGADVHSLRYTWVTELIASGVDPRTVQALAGHADIATTLGIYAQVRGAALESARDALPW